MIQPNWHFPTALALLVMTGCAEQPPAVDLFADLSHNSPYSKPTCPEMKVDEGKYLDLMDVQVFHGPNWDLSEIKPVTTEDEKVKFTLWVPDGLINYWTILCRYQGLKETVEINLPNTTRYCISMLIKEPPPRTPRDIAFWCVPSLIQE